MINNEFLKKLTILFVEDDDIAREQFGKSLKRLFKEVILGVNGEDGYYKFQEARLNNQTIDLILSDINMPKMNGLEMLEKIREIDENIPAMFLTARTETEYLQKAIELNVHHYALKPINLEDTILRIQKVCEKKYYQMVIDAKTDELKNYLNVINKVAAICKFDNEGNIKFINDLFCELFNKDSKELIGTKFNQFFHHTLSSTLADEILSKIKSDQTWNGDIKYENTQNEPFFIRSTIFKIISENGFDYVSIGFLSTQEVEKQREFHKNVLLTISDKSKKATQYKNDLENVQKENNQLKEMHQLLHKEMKHYKGRINTAQNQIEFYEKKILSMDKNLEKKLESRNHTAHDLHDALEKTEHEKDLLNQENKSLKSQHDEYLKEFDRLNDLISQKEKRIDSLSELLEHRESQLRKLDPDTLL